MAKLLSYEDRLEIRSDETGTSAYNRRWSTRDCKW